MISVLFLFLGAIAFVAGLTSKTERMYDIWCLFITPLIFGAGMLTLSLVWRSLAAGLLALAAGLIYASALKVRSDWEMASDQFGEREKLDQKWHERLACSCAYGFLFLIGFAIVENIGLQTP